MTAGSQCIDARGTDSRTVRAASKSGDFTSFVEFTEVRYFV